MVIMNLRKLLIQTFIMVMFVIQLTKKILKVIKMEIYVGML